VPDCLIRYSNDSKWELDWLLCVAAPSDDQSQPQESAPYKAFPHFIAGRISPQSVQLNDS
jgi:hypothetical protein